MDQQYILINICTCTSGFSIKHLVVAEQLSNCVEKNSTNSHPHTQTDHLAE